MKHTLEEAAKEHQNGSPTCEGDSICAGFINGRRHQCYKSFIAGAKWQSKQSPWISVKDRLPEVDTIVLTKGAYGYLLCFLSTLGEWETGAYVNEERLGITHWMPIPEFD